MGFWKGPAKAKGFTTMQNRLVQLTQAQQHIGKVVVCLGIVGTEPQSFLVMSHGVVELAEICAGHAKPAMRCGVIRLTLQGQLVMPHSLDRFSAAKPNVAEVGMRWHEVGLKP